MKTDYQPPIRNLLQKICKDKRVADLACGKGWAGIECLHNGAKFVSLADARPQRIENLPVDQFKNFDVNFIDLNTPSLFKHIYQNTDLIIYMGHLYHSFNHEEILDNLIKSNAQEFVIESKMFLDDPIDHPNIVWFDEETSDEYNIYHRELFLVKVGRPNLEWTVRYLESKNVMVKEIIQGNYWYTKDLVMEYITYTIHAKKLI
jgi:hypothetical protein